MPRPEPWDEALDLPAHPPRGSPEDHNDALQLLEPFDYDTAEEALAAAHAEARRRNALEWSGGFRLVGRAEAREEIFEIARNYLAHRARQDTAPRLSRIARDLDDLERLANELQELLANASIYTLAALWPLLECDPEEAREEWVRTLGSLSRRAGTARGGLVAGGDPDRPDRGGRATPFSQRYGSPKRTMVISCVNLFAMAGRDLSATRGGRLHRFVEAVMNFATNHDETALKGLEDEIRAALRRARGEDRPRLLPGQAEVVEKPGLPLQPYPPVGPPIIE